jgi:cobalt-zinc-cadmium efflux system outer membrane protein
MLLLGAAVTTAALTGGCASLDAQRDFERVGEHVEQAVGHGEIYRLGDDALIESKVRQMVDDGLTSETAVQICLLNNPRLQAAFLNVGIARADVVQSGLLSNPTFGISFKLPAGGGLAGLEAGLAQNLADLWQIPARKRAAERDLDREILTAARTASVLASEAKAAYYGAVAADLLTAISSENRDLVQRLLDMAVARREAGVGTDVEVNLSRSELGERVLTLRRAELAAYEARAELATLLGLETAPDRLLLIEPLPDPPDTPTTAEHLLEIALSQRLDIQAGLEAAAAAEARVREQCLRVFPSLEVGLAFERDERHRLRGGNLVNETARATAQAGTLTVPGLAPQAEEGHGVTLGPSISLELPIFDQNQAQIARARYAYAQAVKTLDAVTREVRQEVLLVYERARVAWENDAFYRDQLLPLRQSGLASAREAYRVGKVSFLAVLESQRTLVEARAGHVAAKLRSALALVQWQQATGRPIDAILSTAADQTAPDPSETGDGVQPQSDDTDNVKGQPPEHDIDT